MNDERRKPDPGRRLGDENPVLLAAQAAAQAVKDAALIDLADEVRALRDAVGRLATVQRRRYFGVVLAIIVLALVLIVQGATLVATRNEPARNQYVLEAAVLTSCARTERVANALREILLNAARQEDRQDPETQRFYADSIARLSAPPCETVLNTLEERG